jgi:hypothetical protein
MLLYFFVSPISLSWLGLKLFNRGVHILDNALARILSDAIWGGNDGESEFKIDRIEDESKKEIPHSLYSIYASSTVLVWLQTVIVIIRPCKLPVPGTYSGPKIGIVFLLKF